MPTYQYTCTSPDCATRFELVQAFTDAAASECPVCGSSVRKVYGSVGVVFKGPGFYRTDSRAAASASTASTTAKSDSKSEAKSDSKSTPAKTETSAPATSGSGASTKAAASA